MKIPAHFRLVQCETARTAGVLPISLAGQNSPVRFRDDYDRLRCVRARPHCMAWLQTALRLAISGACKCPGILLIATQPVRDEAASTNAPLLSGKRQGEARGDLLTL